MPSLPADQGELLVEHLSAYGPRVLRLRGILLMNAIENLRQWGVYERYLEQLSDGTQDALRSVIASSWVPIETVIEHYRVSDRLDVDPARAAQAGQRMGERIAHTFLGITLRTARGAGLDALGFLLRRNGRTWDRMYQGGGTRLRELGKREMLLEDFGNPAFGFELFRHGYFAYWRALAGLCCRSFTVTEHHVESRDALVTHFSWRS